MKYRLSLTLSLSATLLIVFSFSVLAQSPPDPKKPLSVGRWTGRFVDNHLALDYDSIPLVRGGLVQVFDKATGQGRYGSGSNPPKTHLEALAEGGYAYVSQFTYQGEGIAFAATQRVEVRPNNTLVFTIRARFDGPSPATLEWNAARLWAYALLGATYETHDSNHLLASGPIGLRPRSADPDPLGNLSPPWKSATLRQTALGDLTLSSPDAPEGLVLFDGRQDRYMQEDRLFWLGIPGAELPPGQEITRTLTLVVTPKAPAPAPPQKAPPMLLSVATVAIPDAARPLPSLQDTNGRPVIIPQPKQANFTNADFPLSGDLRCFTRLPKNADGRRVTMALRDLLRDTGAHWKQGTRQWRGHGLLIAVEPQKQGRGAESYTLRVTPEAVVVVGQDAAGAFYGLQTLRQLLRFDAEGKAAFAGAEITDWPSLHFRGAHIFTGHAALPFHKKLIERIFSRYKLNALVLECEYTRWKSHPEIYVGYSMPVDDLRKDVAFARDHFLEPIPLVNSLGHSEWIFQNRQHLDLAEDVHSPHAYDASNPNSYKFIFDICSEALEIFHPRLFHIGHDEVKIVGDDVFGKYPARPENIKKGITRLFADDTNRLADWLRKRGARTMLWGDMLLNSEEGDPHVGVPHMTAANAATLEEARQRRALMPKDALLADWRYEAGSEQRNGLAIFKAAGFDALGCAWYEPENIRGWAQQAIQKNALGLLQTTWAGYDSNESLLDEEFKQFTAYVLAAEYAWSGTTLHPRLPDKPATSDTLPYTAAEVFTRAYRADATVTARRPGWYVSLRQAANIALNPAPDAARAWTVYTDAPDSPLSGETFPALADVGVRVNGQNPGGILLASPLAPTTDGQKPLTYPSAISFPIHARAEKLAFLHAVGFGTQAGTRVGTYTIFYADGKHAEIPLRYGIEIRALDDNADTSFTTTPLSWNGLTLRLLRWSNPRPGVEIERIAFRADEPLAAPVLFGVTGM